MLLVTKCRFVAKGMTRSTFSNETISSQKNRTFRDEAEVVTIAYLTPSRRRRFAFPSTLRLSGDTSPSVIVVASAHRHHRLPLRRFILRDASTPKCFQQRFAFLSPDNASPSVVAVASARSHRFILRDDSSLRQFRRNRNTSSFMTLPATFHPSATLHPLRRFNFMQQSVRISEKSCLVETKKDKLVDEEFLTDFVLHDENGVPQLLEMLEFDDMFISGLILPLEEGSDKENENVIKCEGFGRLD
nr:dna (cytosine-5)-methyltransferase 1 [Quercus suber]